MVFFPTVIVSLAFFLGYMAAPDRFDHVLSWLNDLFTQNLGWFYLLVALFLVIVSFVVLFSKMGKMRIGGEYAKPMLSTGSWFNIVLCTTIAAGLIFWGSSEPLFHLMEPPEFLGIEPASHDAAVFSMSTMFLHWTLTPYAIYSVPALIFAIAVYNQKRPFSFSSCMAGVIPSAARPGPSALIDSVCVFATVMGMVASLGQGILSVAGGLAEVTDLESSSGAWIIIGVSLVVVFTLSACSGVLKGIRWISNVNVIFLLLMLAFIFLLGPTVCIIQIALESFGVYLDTFFTRNLMMGAGSSSIWSSYWTISTYANWAAWAPITGMFLGKIAYGQSVRKFILINFITCSLSSGLWVSIFAGTSLDMQLTGKADLYSSMLERGTESAVYEVLHNLPAGMILIPLLVATVYLCFVTAADSTTNALGDLCCTASGQDSKTSLLTVKIVWGVLIGIMAIILICSNGVAGIKMLSAIGGLPAMILLLLSGVSLLKVTIKYQKGNGGMKHEETTYRNGL